MKKKNRSILIEIQKLCSGQKILTKTTLRKQTNKEKNSDAEKNTVLDLQFMGNTYSKNREKPNNYSTLRVI